jgi:hypothetical protein
MRGCRPRLVLLVLAGAGVARAEGKLPVPADADQEPVRTHVRTLFKAGYANTTPAALLALSDKLTAGAAEEKDRPAARYVMLTEAIGLAVKGGDIERAVRAAQKIDHDFDAPGLKDLLASAFAEHIGAKERLATYRDIAAAEMTRPADAKEQVDLGQKWREVAKQVISDSRLTAIRRARQWLCEALRSQNLEGLAHTEAEKLCRDVTDEIERADARAGRFALYEGKWVVKYENNYTHEYVISADGSLAFDRCISPDGTPFVKKDEQKAKLVRRGGAVLVPFAGGKLLERLSMEGDKLVVERFDPSSLYPERPNNKGEGVREK